MSQLYETIHAILARGPRTTNEVVTECHRAGLPYRPEAIGLFLHLCRDAVERDGAWRCRGGSKHDRILAGLQQAFAAGQTYLPMDRLSQFLDDGEPITGDDIAKACRDSGQYRLQGKLILRTV